MEMKKRIIGVIGASECSEEIYRKAEEVGRQVATLGAHLICGGLGGVMEASAKGAKSAGGFTLGILPGLSTKDANPYIDFPIATNMGHARNVVIAQTAELLIAVSGEYGTLSEISIGLKLGKPVFCLGSWDHVPGVVAVSSIQELVQKVRSCIG